LNSGLFIRNDISTIGRFYEVSGLPLCDQKLGKNGFFRGEHVPDTK